MPETEAPDIASFGVDYLPKTVPAASEEPPSIERDVFSPAKTQAITQQHADIERERGQQMDYASRQMEGRVEQDRARMDAAYRREAASLDDPALKPWNADKERADRIRGPMEQFGSVANIFAMVASAFTRAPMTSAFNAGAAAMTAIQQHDEKGYESAYDAWKKNVDLALKRFDMEKALVDDANKLFSVDMNAWRAKQAEIAARFDHKTALMFLENGMDAKLFEMQSAAANAADGMRKARQGMDEYNLNKTLFAQGKKAFKQEHPNASPKEDLQNSLELVHSIKSANTGINYSTLSPERMFIQQRVPELMKPVEQGGQGLDATTAMRRAEEEWRDSQKSYLMTDNRLQAQRKIDLSKQYQKPAEEGGLGLSKIEADRKASEEVNREVMAAKSRIDQAIINQTKHYPGMNVADLGFIPPARQTKLAAAFESAAGLENIAAYVKANPEALGLVADIQRKMNLDAYQGLRQKGDRSNSPADIAELRDKSTDDFDKAADKTLPMTQAAKAKVLNKLLATQAFADAAAAGSRGATIYLDKAFREIYQQASSPAAFYSILEQRYKEADRVASEYRMDFDSRDDVDKMPFWRGKAVGYAGESAHIELGADGKKFKFIGSDYNDPAQRRERKNWQQVQ